MIRREEDKEQPNEIHEPESTHKRLALTAGERRLLQDIYLTDFDNFDENTG
jgi:hypothetical protein